MAAHLALSHHEAASFRRTLQDHRNRPGTGACAICRAPRCHAWLTSFDTLAAANELMAEPRDIEEWSRTELYTVRAK